MAAWSEYFEEVVSFLHSLERYASESFTEYAVERIRMCISNVTRIEQVLSHAIENSSSSSDPVIERYDALCAELYHLCCQCGGSMRATLALHRMRHGILHLSHTLVDRVDQSL